MRIFTSFHSDDIEIQTEIVRELRTSINGAKIYPIDLLGFLGPKDIFNPIKLHDALKFPNLAIVLLSSSYVTNPWFIIHELPSLFALERHYETNIILPILVGDINDEQIPEYLRDRKPIDFRNKPLDEGLNQLVIFISQGLSKRNTKKVFIVHGHDIARDTVALLLTQLGLEPIILKDQSGQGKAIIERLEDYQDVPFALILLTPDDIGTSRETPDKLQGRARQNVIFELGFFIGALGRSRVRALLKGPLEIPSDYHGVIYISMDDYDWKSRLTSDLKDAGYTLNL